MELGNCKQKQLQNKHYFSINAMPVLWSNITDRPEGGTG